MENQGILFSRMLLPNCLHLETQLIANAKGVNDLRKDINSKFSAQAKQNEITVPKAKCMG